MSELLVLTARALHLGLVEALLLPREQAPLHFQILHKPLRVAQLFPRLFDLLLCDYSLPLAPNILAVGQLQGLLDMNDLGL